MGVNVVAMQNAANSVGPKFHQQPNIYRLMVRKIDVCSPHVTNWRGSIEIGVTNLSARSTAESVVIKNERKKVYNGIK